MQTFLGFKLLKKPLLISVLIGLTTLSSTVYSQNNLTFSNVFKETISELGNNHATGNFSLMKSFSSPNFNVHHYTCNWKVDPAVRFISGNVTISFQTTEDASGITLDMSDSLKVDSVVQGNFKLSYIHDSNRIIISFENVIPLNQADSISVYYHGTPPQNGFGSFTTSVHNSMPVMWTLSEPYGARDWWPCKDGLYDKADSLDVYISSPSAYTSVSNGLRVMDTVINSIRTTHWKHRYPIATYLVCMAVTNYSEFQNRWDVPGDSLLMQTFCYPESENSFVQGTPNAHQAMKYFWQLLEPYPFANEKYGHVQFGFAGGEEHQTSTFIYRPDESLMAHEMAHQWFGDKVTCGSWQDIWLNEGFATHMASMFMEQKYPLTVINTRKSEIQFITSVPNGSVFVDDTSSVSRIFNNRLTYIKGSHLLYMLRWIMGDSVFFKGIRSYLDDPALSYKFAVTKDLQRHLEAVYGKSLDYFFNEWFYGQGYPSYHIDWWIQSNGTIGLKVNQTTSDPSVAFFHLPLPVRFSGGNNQKDFVINQNFNGQVFYLQPGFIPDSLTIDPDYRLITNGNTVQKTVRPENITEVKIFPNPAANFLNIFMNGFEETNIHFRLFDFGGRLVINKEEHINGSINATLDLSRFPSGIYLLRLQTANGFTHLYKIKKGL